MTEKSYQNVKVGGSLLRLLDHHAGALRVSRAELLRQVILRYTAQAAAELHAEAGAALGQPLEEAHAQPE